MTLEREPRSGKKAGRCGRRAAPYPLFQEDHRRPVETQMSCSSSHCLCGPCGSTRWLGHHGGATDSSNVLLDRMGSGILCCSAATLAPVQTSPRATKYEESIRA